MRTRITKGQRDRLVRIARDAKRAREKVQRLQIQAERLLQITEEEQGGIAIDFVMDLMWNDASIAKTLDRLGVEVIS